LAQDLADLLLAGALAPRGTDIDAQLQLLTEGRVEANLPTGSPSASTSASAHTRRPPARMTRASARSRSIFFAFTGRMNRAKISIVVIALL
jgi:hypothetical protein